MSNFDPETWNLSSVTGITSITFLILEILKAYIHKTTPIIGKIPTWVFPIVVAFGLALTANKLIYIDGKPVLPGNFWVIAGKAFLAALGSSGIHSTLKNIATPIGVSKPLIEETKEKK